MSTKKEINLKKLNNSANLGSRIRFFRKSMQKSQEEFALLLDVSKHTLINYETGKRVPDASFFLKLINSFNLSSDYLLTGEGEMFRQRIPFITGILQDETMIKMLEYVANIPEIRYSILAEFQKAVTIFEKKIKEYEDRKTQKKETIKYKEGKVG
jgi:transcriptional regulator with XRE-family HTH domain